MKNIENSMINLSNQTKQVNESNESETLKQYRSEMEEINKENKFLDDENKSLTEELDQINQLNLKLKEEIRSFKTKRKRLLTTSVKPIDKFYSVANFDNQVQNETNHDDNSYISLLKKLKAHMKMVLDPNELNGSTSEDIQELKDIFKIDSGRRIFANELEGYTQGKAKEVSESNFDLILFLINFALNELNLSNGADFISGKLLLSSSWNIYRKNRGKNKNVSPKEFIGDFIRTHPLWQNMEFWNEYFWDSASHKYSNLLNDQHETVFLEKYLKKFAKIMEKQGNVDVDSIIKLCSDIIKSLEIENNVRETLMSKIRSSLGK